MSGAAELLSGESFDFVSAEDKAFICAFAQAMDTAGYTFGGKISDGVCWGRYMLVFTKSNVKSKTVYARIYIKNDGIVLRFYFNGVEKHGNYILSSPDFIKNVFTGSSGSCGHCKGDDCRFRKRYIIGGAEYEKCNGVTFEFYQPDTEKLDDYMELFREFYPIKKNNHKA